MVHRSRDVEPPPGGHLAAERGQWIHVVEDPLDALRRGLGGELRRAQGDRPGDLRRGHGSAAPTGVGVRGSEVAETDVVDVHAVVRDHVVRHEPQTSTERRHPHVVRDTHGVLLPGA